MKIIRKCIRCGKAQTRDEFTGSARICNGCKEESALLNKNSGNSRTMPRIDVGAKRNSDLRLDNKNSKRRLLRANDRVDKYQIAEDPARKSVRVKLKSEDLYGRTNKIVGKNWAKQLEEIKQRIKHLNN